MVDKDEYETIFKKAVAELAELLERQAALDSEREKIDARILEVKQGILALGPLCGIVAQNHYPDLLPEYNFFPVGLKEGVLAVLAKVGNNAYITPVTVRDNLASTGYEIKSKNILPSIHNVLKRLDGREVESADVNGKTGYRLKNVPKLKSLKRLAEVPPVPGVEPRPIPNETLLKALMGDSFIEKLNEKLNK